MRKQEKRALALKQKLLLKFLSGDALQKAKDSRGPARPRFRFVWVRAS